MQNMEIEGDCKIDIASKIQHVFNISVITDKNIKNIKIIINK